MFLRRMAAKMEFKLSIFTSDNGVEGLGYIYAADPAVIIVDSTLPRYSGKEIIDFIAQNKKFSQKDRRVIILHDVAKWNHDIPANFVVIDKSSPQFLTLLLEAVLEHIYPDQLAKIALSQQGLFARLASAAVARSVQGDKVMTSTVGVNLPRKLLLYSRWLLLQLAISLKLTLVKLMMGESKDDNLAQLNQDLLIFRTRYYPTLGAVLIGFSWAIFQVVAYTSTSLAILQVSDRVPEVSAAFGNGYTYRRTLTIDETKVSGSADHTSFPILVAGTYSYLATTGNGGKVTNANGYDIIFTSDSAGSVKLDHEIEQYVATTGEITMWVRIPTLDYNDNTVIYMFYGNSSISTSQQNITAVWDSNYKAVFHLAEANGSENQQMLDSTSNNNDSNAVTLTDQGVAGKAGLAIQLDGTDDRVQFPDSASLDITSSYTVEAWAKSSHGTTFDGILHKTQSTTNTNYELSIRTSQKYFFNMRIASVDYNLSSNTTAVTNGTTWQYVAGAFDDGNNLMRIYYNGAADGTLAQTSNPTANTGVLNLGRNRVSNFLAGHLDEVRISNTQRSADWLLTNYNAINDPSTFYTIGSEEQSAPEVTVSTNGSQTSTSNIPATGKYLGGSFLLTNAASDATVTGMTITEQGTIDAANHLKNVKLLYEKDTTNPYNCASVSYAGDESQFGSTDADGFSSSNGSSSFTGSVSLSSTEALCVYVVVDVQSGASDGQTIEVQITNPSTEVTIASGTVAPGTAVAISGTTTLDTITSTVSTTGSQSSTVRANKVDKYIGGNFIFATSDTSGVSSLTITESGSIDAAANLKNIRMFYDVDSTAPYDCAGESFSFSDFEFGTTDADGFSSANGTSTFTGSTFADATNTLCFYVALDVESGASAGETIEISIADTQTDIGTSNSSHITPTGALAIAGTTTVVAATHANGYDYRRAVTVDHTDVAGSANLTDFPVVVSGTYSDLIYAGNGGKVENANGYDIIFTSDEAGSSQLSHELERYVFSTGEVVLWVKIPTLDYDNDTVFYMFYGNPNISTSQESITSTWSASFGSVYHFEQNPSLSAPQMLNSVSNTKEGTTGGSWSGANVTAAKIGRGLDFQKAQSDRVVTTDNQTGNNITVSAWVNGDLFDQNVEETIAMRANSTPNDRQFLLYARTAGGTHPALFNAFTPGGSYDGIDTIDLSTSTWYYITGTYDGTTVRYYRDGVQRGTATCSSNCTVGDSNRAFWVGGNEVWGEYFDGKIDEFRVVNAARTADWILTEYNNQNSPSTFYTLGDENETPNDAPTLSSISLNGGADIDLTEATTTQVLLTATATDTDGYADLVSVTGKLYRSGASGAEACTPNDNNCYIESSSSLTSCSGNTCTATLTFDVEFHAEPTDSGAYSAEYWLGWLEIEDDQAATDSDFSASNVVDVNSLLALNATSSINYGTLLPGTNSGATNQTITITNTGNMSIDLNLSGTALCPDYPTCASVTIPVGNQEYSLSTFTFGAGTDLSTTPTAVNISLTKPTASPSNSSGTIYWGIAVPNPLASGSFTGTVTVTAVGDT